MKHLTKNVIIITILFLITSCTKDDAPSLNMVESQISLSTHKLTAYSTLQNSKYLVVFEAGLGDDHTVWNEKKILAPIYSKSDVVIYDRAGYGKSEAGSNPRNIDKLRSELERVVAQFSNGRKVILVGHSIGGLIIRDFAIKNPNKTAGLLFIDPSHENYNQPTQEIEDIVYGVFNDAYGPNFGGTKEARELIEDFAYTSTLTDLPDIPVIVLTSIKQDQANITTDEAYGKTRQDWYDAHDLLKMGITDFTHIATTKSGHYIMNDEPDLVIENFNLLLSKLPL